MGPTGLSWGRKGAKLLYRYDYGDDWEHLVVLGDVTDPDPRHSYPLCIGGARACPPEDCGGTSGYEDLVRVLKSPDDEEHDSMLTWLGGRSIASARQSIHTSPGCMRRN